MYEYDDEMPDFTNSRDERDYLDDLAAIGEGQWNRDGVVWDDPDLLVDVDD